MQKRWAEQELKNLKAVKELQDQLNIDEVLATLLVNRNITSIENAQRFFEPELAQLHDPLLMKGMDIAVSRIQKALLAKEKILIYGDYDVDGTTSVALVFSFFRKYHYHIDYYIPDRDKEGCGISTEGIDYAHKNGITLIIALDCGIKSVDKVEYANSLHIDFIICDHHLPGCSIPDAIAVLDPKQADCSYPYKELSGCGIGFKLIQAFAIRNGFPFKDLECYLDLVAVSIASDIVPITGENRILAKFGLKRLNTSPCHGMAALIEITGKKQYTISDVVFTLGPRINASGRIDDARHSVNLLISENRDIARAHSHIINIKNAERKEHDASITEQALAMIAADPNLLNRKSTVVYNESWHKGVIGIVASRLTEKYYRPTIVLTQSNGQVSGSARSVIGFDIYEALNSCSDLFEQFGGHKYAAGITLKTENLSALQERFEEVVSKTIPDALLVQELVIDAKIKLEKIDSKFFRVLNKFAPFGPLNSTPIFISEQVTCLGHALVVGNNHIKMTVKQGNSIPFDCIGFGLGDSLDIINENQAFDICYTIEENVWKEKRSIQLNLKGVRRTPQHQ